jgi:hypothetical protein
MMPKSLAPPALALAASLVVSGCGKPVQDQLKEFGYSELQPPSVLLPPGTFVALKQSSPLMVGIVCTRESAFGDGIGSKVVSSPSITSSQTKSLEGSFSLSANYVKGLTAGASAKADAVEGITVKMANVVIQELPDEVVIELFSKRSGPCTEAIALRRQKNARVSLIKSVVAADVTYVIRYATSVAADAKVELTKKIAAQLGMTGARTGEESVSGTQLLWGVRDDADLAAYNGGTLAATGSATRTRLMTAGQMVGVDPTPP